MRVAELWRFPVKSLGGERVDRVEVGERGVDGDRRWGIVDLATGRILTARRSPELLFGRARLVADGVAITIGDGTVLADDSALSDWLGRSVRLVRAEPGVRSTYETPLDFEHEATSEWVTWQGPEGTFHDSTTTQVSLLSRHTIGEWDLRRFRANVVLDGQGETEMVGATVAVGGAELRVVKSIDRCVVTTRPQPGVDRDLDVLRTINRERESFLGVGALVHRPGMVAVGDMVEVHSPPAG